MTLSQAALFYAEHKDLLQFAYNMTTVVTVAGSLSSAELVRACHRLSAATPSMRLRMGINGSNGEIRYWFSTDELDVQVFDLPGAESKAAHRLIDEVSVRRFECDGGPLARFVIVRTESDRSYVALVCHHLAVDGPSHARLIRRLGEAVDGEIEVEREADYVDLVRRVRNLETLSRADDLSYWRARIPENSGESSWSSGASEGGGVPGELVAAMPSGTARRLEQAAVSDGVRTFNIIAAAVHQSLPARGTREAFISTAASIRPRKKSVGDVTGYFVNEVPLLADQRAGETLRQLAVRQAPRWREDLRRRYIPFAELANYGNRREGHQSALDRVVLSYRTQPRGLFWRGRAASFAADLRPRHFKNPSDLAIRIFHDSGTLECDVRWSSALPDGAGERFAKNLINALTKI